MGALLQVGLPTYVHEQNTPDALWVINHNLNSPSLICDVMLDIDGVLEVVIPSNITYASNNQILIDWTGAHTGRARIA